MRAPDGFRGIRAKEPDDLDPEAVAAHRIEQLEIKNDYLRERIESIRQDREQRGKYADRIFHLVVGYLVTIGLIVIADGLDRVPFSVPVAALATLVGSTAVSVLGLFGIVAAYLFSKR